MDDIDAEKLILKDISKTPVLPIITKGPLAGCFLANSVNVQIPFPNLPKIVAEGWAWEGDPLLARDLSITRCLGSRLSCVSKSFLCLSS